MVLDGTGRPASFVVTTGDVRGTGGYPGTMGGGGPYG